MANGFLRFLSAPIRPASTKRRVSLLKRQILPADDILDFEYPPESSFAKHGVNDDDLIQG